MSAMSTEDPSLEVGTRIRRARERLQLSQRDLAKAVGVDVKTVGNWERGRVRGIRNRVGALEAVLGVQLDGPPEAGPVIPPDLERRLAQLTPEERAYVVGMLTAPRGDGAPEDGDALREAR
jgi:putative transcriptional regulator